MKINIITASVMHRQSVIDMSTGGQPTPPKTTKLLNEGNEEKVCERARRADELARYRVTSSRLKD
jgi:hypothetical protein